MDNLRLLTLGPLPPPFGGATVLHDQFVRDLACRADVRVAAISTTGIRGRGLGTLPRVAWLALRIAGEMWSADVVVAHLSNSGLPLLLSLLLPLKWLLRRPLVVRKFGGEIREKHRGILLKGVVALLKRCDLYLVETKAQVRAARECNIQRAVWYPNSRQMEPLSEEATADRSCRKFVFVSQVRRDKGICELIEAAERFPDGAVQIDVFGPLVDIEASLLEERRNVTYRGVLEPCSVVATLRKYDALVLPTYYRGEGQPGAILEAYSAGIPVIATRHGGIPEIVDTELGLLIEPRDATALYSAMEQLHEDNRLYVTLLSGVRRKRSEFSSSHWAEVFVRLSRDLKAGEFPCSNANQF